MMRFTCPCHSENVLNLLASLLLRGVGWVEFSFFFFVANLLEFEN